MRSLGSPTTVVFLVLAPVWGGCGQEESATVEGTPSTSSTQDDHRAGQVIQSGEWRPRVIWSGSDEHLARQPSKPEGLNLWPLHSRIEIEPVARIQNDHVVIHTRMGWGQVGLAWLG